MTRRERILAMILAGTLLIVGGGFLLFFVLLPAVAQKKEQLANLRKTLDSKNKQLHDIEERKAKLDLWRKESLPANVELAMGEYEKYLSDTLADNGFTKTKTITWTKETDSASTTAARGKKTGYTRLTYRVPGHVTLGNLVKFLDKFYHTPLLHQIRSMTIMRPATFRTASRPRTQTGSTTRTQTASRSRTQNSVKPPMSLMWS